MSLKDRLEGGVGKARVGYGAHYRVPHRVYQFFHTDVALLVSLSLFYTLARERKFTWGVFRAQH